MHFQAIVSSVSFASFVIPALAASHDPKVHNANHIFNAIHSSMRQWGSSLNHNGMSFFVATVPAGTQLYHGTSKQEPVKGLEWLAFEPEHALMFARPRGPPPGRRPPEDGDEPPNHQEEKNILEEDDAHEKEWDQYPHPHPRPGHQPHEPSMHYGPPPPAPHHPHEPPNHSVPPPPPFPIPHDDFHPPPRGPHHEPSPDPNFPHPPPPPPFAPHHRPPPPHKSPGHYEPPPPPPFPEGPPPHKRERQQPFAIPSSKESRQSGYLHTYTPVRSLNLLYIDGMSAGKTSNGTLDTQDILLLNMTEDRSHGPMGGEFERAKSLCNLSSTLWENKIDGVLRMELGFEIILCDFERDLEVRDIMAVTEGEHWGRTRGVGWRYQQAVADRYHGIGGRRAVLDYEAFVSVFEYPGLDLWTNDVKSDVPMPRLTNVNDTTLVEIRDVVTDMILKSNKEETREAKTNWQEVADMVIQRYSEPLHYLHTNPAVRASKEDFAEYLEALLRLFIDYTDRNSTTEIGRCISQLVPAFPHPPSRSASLAHRTIHAITQEVCTTLLTTLDITTLSLSRSLAPTSPPPSHALELVDTLVSYLQWTTWKECGTCPDNKLCIIPIWPMGSLEDHANPRCKTDDEFGWPGNYWGHFGRPPPEKEEPAGPGLPAERLAPGGPWKGRGSSRHADGYGYGYGNGRGRWHGHERGRGRMHGHGRKACSHRRGRGVWGRVERAARRIGGWLRLRLGGVGWMH